MVPYLDLFNHWIPAKRHLAIQRRLIRELKGCLHGAA